MQLPDPRLRKRLGNSLGLTEAIGSIDWTREHINLPGDDPAVHALASQRRTLCGQDLPWDDEGDCPLYERTTRSVTCRVCIRTGRC